MPTNKDYWPEILKRIDAEGKIQAPKRKTLDLYLGKELKLSRPTVVELLSKWEEEGKIRLEKEGLTKKLVGLQILSPKEEEPKPLGKLLILIDLENLLQNMEPSIEKELSVSEIFLKLIKRVSREIGEVVSVFVFTSPHLVSVWGETFYNQGFFVISCPKVTDKKGEEKDTVDETLIDFGRKMIQNMNLSHLVIGTGDRDLSPLYQDGILKGLKIVTIAASEKSLSSKLIPLSDKIIILSSLEKGQE